ncbi:Alpha-(1,3)-fucosyltransferase fut-1 [Caenorhabditis elegans]|uniref:Alpha-(1,3)-fucosyltransferase fut-1 n=1 Tax=Caenorhabditis elegans TaxID=6239 RepID=FUTA_CAEEL|nr:Alpha-(1,3)-fucosyltransferase fut-1 [Caenorhabditis elegans]G5EDR5.1 RecName: Full=Alpha-(1,3)-fucosyltransferase fut-1; AltName: Full=Fucosyltransferase fut-1 [Caenorhabditis elegans]CAA91285.2 Alpha-(1,3)-fucosyltransferase fut-1 [Caenorhabditis elegans]CAG32977.1 core alpha1,3-fucosyltransferase [Caenorhabditis elegans]|eukprot:NP_495862.2 Alpha-(1,3)-fucosyltransferase fut-1 [Caenorhabditis elegans]
MTARSIKLFFARWKYLMFACCITYLLVIYAPISKSEQKDWKEGEIELSNDHELDVPILQKEELKPQQRPSFEENVPKKKTFNFNPVGKEPFDVEEVLTSSDIKLEERMTATVIPGQKRLILSWNAGHSQDNLQGCPDWNCEFTQVRARAPDADAVLIAHMDNDFVPKPNQYVVYFSQESPANSGIQIPRPDYINMTLGFRHDTPAGSPYGYTVKLGAKSRKTGQVVDANLVNGKAKGAAWFVSHCQTNSKREDFVKKLQKHLQIDIYGGCGPMKCARGDSKCDTMLDTDYHFYVTFENSICEDYVTEKLWKSGYQNTIIPLVLKRKLVEPFVPPNSFIAIDDFKSVKEMGDYLNYLMNNKTAYMEYFEWRHDYKVVFLDGSHHDVLERPWGFCQVCRMAWTEPRQKVLIPNWDAYWRQTCEKDGTLVDSIPLD